MVNDEALAELLRSSGLTLALAESCTGGMIAARITAVPGSSGYFRLGVVVYHNDAKQRLLSVPEQLLIEHGAVSEPVARAMAEGALSVAGSDIALSVTGIAGPEGGTPEKPVGTVFIAIADGHGCKVQRNLFSGNRETIRQQATEQALFLIESHVLGAKKPIN